MSYTTRSDIVLSALNWELPGQDGDSDLDQAAGTTLLTYNVFSDCVITDIYTLINDVTAGAPVISVQKNGNEIGTIPVGVKAIGDIIHLPCHIELQRSDYLQLKIKTAATGSTGDKTGFQIIGRWAESRRDLGGTSKLTQLARLNA